MQTETHRFKPGDTVIHHGKEEEWVRIQGLTLVNGQAAYWSWDLHERILDVNCSVPPVPVE